MSRSAPFRLNRSAVLVSLISAAFAGQAYAAAGRVDFAAGNVTVAGSDGRERPLAKGTDLDNGDTVRTTDGRAQIRFSDGSYVSLQPNTEFSIKDYRFEGKADGKETGFFALVKGAMRTVTGLIGRVNRNRYRISTPTATVGIRGTGGVIQVLNDGSTLIVGTSGIWSLTNPSGSIDVPAGVSGLAPSAPDQPPQQTSQQPSAGPSPTTTEPTEFSTGEEQTDTGTSLIVEQATKTEDTKPASPTVLVTGSGYAAVVMSHPTSNNPRMDGTVSSGLATFDASGKLTEIQNVNGFSHGIAAGGAHVDSATDGILAWGRWTGDTLFCGECASPAGFPANSYATNEGLHYVVGTPTATLPTQGTATYSLLGATKPTYTDGGNAPGIFTGGLSVAFGTTTRVSTVDWNVSMPDRNFAIANTQISTTSSSFLASQVPVSGCAGQTCEATISGFFAGSAAARVGAGYHITDYDGEVLKQVIGTAAFKKN